MNRNFSPKHIQQIMGVKERNYTKQYIRGNGIEIQILF